MIATIWDIETGPLDPETVTAMAADEVAAELRHYTDPTPTQKIKRGEPGYEAACMNQAALGAVTGRVLALGLHRRGKFFLVGNDTCDDAGERTVLEKFWELADRDFASVTWDKWKPHPSEPRWVGFNSNGFDLPFILTRSLILIPDFVYPLWCFPERWIHRMWLDLRNFGQRMGGPARGNLDTLCRSLGIQGKNGDGAHFAELWCNPATRLEAREYLANDIEMTRLAALRLAPEILAA